MQQIRLEMRKFSSLRELNGIPARTMETLNESYKHNVHKATEIFDKLARTDHGLADSIYSELRSLKLGLPVALGAVKSYEIFFGLLGGKGGRPTSTVEEALRRDFGSYEQFVADLKATAIASRGWVALVLDLNQKRLLNVLGDTPVDLAIWNWQPILVIEVSERTIGADFNRDRTLYIDAVLKNLDWNVVESNLEGAMSIHPAGSPA